MSAAGKQRLIFHCDCNNFFASCECLDHPELKDVPLAVAGDPENRTGVVVAKDELAADPHLKFATGDCDTGVIVSWNIEGPKNVEENTKTPLVMPNEISINPLNWKLDNTYAPASENLGSLVPNPKTGELEIVDIGADVQVIPSRGVVVTNANFEPMEAHDLFGPQSFHNGDYIFYYNNIKDNVAKRIAAYKSNH